MGLAVVRDRIQIMVKGTHGKRHPPSAGRGNLAGLIQAFLDSLYLIIRISAFFRLEVPGPELPRRGHTQVPAHHGPWTRPLCK